MAQATVESPRVAFVDLLRIREFNALWLGEAFSIAGDQIARVSLSILVWDRTSSALLTGVMYALTFVPSLVGGVLLSGFGDRFPRRDVMMVSDLMRFVLVGLMALPGTPLWIMCALVGAVTLLDGPFKAAQQALLPDVLTGGRFMVGMAFRNVSSQAAQVLGFVTGGLLVHEFGALTGLAVNAASYLTSALLMLAVVRRPAAKTPESESFLASTATGLRLICHDPVLRTLACMNLLAGFYVTAEAMSAPYVGIIGGGGLAVGVLMAADPLGSVIGAVVFGRAVSESTQRKIIGFLAILAGAPLMLVIFTPPLLVTIILFAFSGAFATCYTLTSTVSFVRRVPDEYRAQASGMNATLLITVQGVGALVAGGVADLIGPANAIAGAGIVGAIMAVPIAFGWARHRHLVDAASTES